MSEEQPTAAPLPLPERMKFWRTAQGYTLHEARNILNLSIGYISGLEAGKVPITIPVFRKYHEVAPDHFPLEDAGLLI